MSTLSSGLVSGKLVLVACDSFLAQRADRIAGERRALVNDFLNSWRPGTRWFWQPPKRRPSLEEAQALLKIDQFGWGWGSPWDAPAHSGTEQAWRVRCLRSLALVALRSYYRAGAEAADFSQDAYITLTTRDAGDIASHLPAVPA